MISPESVRWAAEHQYPYIALAPPRNVIDEIYDLYDATAAKVGFTPTSDHRGYVIRVSVADTDDEAYEQGRHFYWQLGTSFGIVPLHWLQPPGYVSREARESRREAARRGTVNIVPGGPVLSYEGARATYQIVSGNPDTVIKKLQHIIDAVDPAYRMVLWGREGMMSRKVAMHGIDLMTREVIPAIRRIARTGRGGAQSSSPRRQRDVSVGPWAEAHRTEGNDMFKIKAMDHIVLNVPDINRSLAFYMDVLGLEAERLDEFRRGEVRFPSVRVSADTVIDLFPMKPGEALGDGPGLQNLNHFTMVVEASDFEAFQKHLADRGVRIDDGPGRRWGARGHGQSVYFRDPDGNRIEVRCYPSEAG